VSRLHRAGYDVIAAADDPVLVTLADEELLGVAVGEGRAIATGNARDFDRIMRASAVAGEHHAGVIFVSPCRFHRGSSAHPTSLVAVLEATLSDPPRQAQDWIRWLA
jgi:hypothetical protein